MDIQTATVVIAGISVIIGVLNSIISSRRANQQRQTQLFMQLYNQWTAPALVSSYGNIRYNTQYPNISDIDAFQKAVFEPFNEEIWKHNHMLINFFEGVGVLVQEGFIDIKLVENLFSKRFNWYWETQMGPGVEYWRKRLNDSNMYDSLEYLYNELKQREIKAQIGT
jgi:hypothetical protein